VRAIGLFAAALTLCLPHLWMVTVPTAVLFCPHVGPDHRSLYELLRDKA
jgi:hypothetical protein